MTSLRTGLLWRLFPGHANAIASNPRRTWRSRAANCVDHLPRPIQAALLRAAPGSSASWGPPRRWAPAADVAKMAGGEWRPLFGAAREETYSRTILPEDRAALAALDPVYWSAAGVAVIPGGRVVSPHGFAVGPADTLLVDASFSRDGPASEVWKLPRIRRTRRLSGCVLNLGSTWAPYNFAHQLLDVWPRWEIVRRAGWRWSDFDHVLAPAPNFAVSAAVTEQIGLPRDRVQSLQRGEQVVCDTLVQPTHPSGQQAAHYPRWVLDFFRHLQWPAAPDAPSRIYVGRGTGGRRLTNEPELLDELRRDGFVVVDPSELGARAPAWFAAAAEIVAPHGAALAHLVFCRAGTRVVEIFPQDHVVAYYASLAGAGGLDYGAVAGSHQQGTKPASAFSVDIGKVLRVLQTLRRQAR